MVQQMVVVCVCRVWSPECVWRPNERWLCSQPNERWDHFWDKRGPCSRHHPLCEAILPAISLLQTFAQLLDSFFWPVLCFCNCSRMQISFEVTLSCVSIATYHRCINEPQVAEYNKDIKCRMGTFIATLGSRTC